VPVLLHVEYSLQRELRFEEKLLNLSPSPSHADSIHDPMPELESQKAVGVGVAVAQKEEKQELFLTY
jgi:hypothetical protein